MGSTAYFTRFGQCSEKGNSLDSSERAETQPEVNLPRGRSTDSAWPWTREKVKGLPKDRKVAEPQIPPITSSIFQNYFISNIEICSRTLLFLKIMYFPKVIWKWQQICFLLLFCLNCLQRKGQLLIECEDELRQHVGGKSQKFITSQVCSSFSHKCKC